MQAKNKKIRILSTAAVLCALAVGIAALCKSFTIPPNLRVTFENLPIILAGYLFGPLTGFAVGLITDLITALAFYGGGMNPIITLGAGCVGLFAGLFSKIFAKRKPKVRLAASVSAAHITGNMLVKSAGLMIWYGSPFIAVLPRVVLYIAIGIIEFILLKLLLSSKGIKKALGDF